MRALASRLALLSFASIAISACLADSEEPTEVTSAPSKTRIAAKEGGTVSDPSGIATLTIPPGALAEDTDITLSVSAATSATVASVYDFGPDGLAFLEPVMLEVKVDAAAVGDKQVAVALESEGRFVALSGSTYANGIASAKIEHFSSFSVIYVDGKALEGACDDKVEAFDACGGDLSGTWRIEEMCFAGIENAAAASCPEWTLDVDMDFGGMTYTFAEGGAFTRSAYEATITRTIGAPLSCFDGAAECAMAMSRSPEWACSGGDICECTYAMPDASDSKESTYRVDGSKVAVGKTLYEYCVDGDSLYLVERKIDSIVDAEARLITFKRQ